MHAQNQHRSRHGLDPSGTHLYVANTTPTKSISGFSIGAGGILTSVGPDAVVSGATDLTNLVVDPSGTHIYVLDSDNGTTNGQLFGFSIGSSGVIGSAIPGTPVAAGVLPIGGVVALYGRNDCVECLPFRSRKVSPALFQKD